MEHHPSTSSMNFPASKMSMERTEKWRNWPTGLPPLLGTDWTSGDMWIRVVWKMHENHEVCWHIIWHILVFEHIPTNHFIKTIYPNSVVPSDRMRSRMFFPSHGDVDSMVVQFSGGVGWDRDEVSCSLAAMLWDFSCTWHTWYCPRPRRNCCRVGWEYCTSWQVWIHNPKGLIDPYWFLNPNLTL